MVLPDLLSLAHYDESEDMLVSSNKGIGPPHISVCTRLRVKTSIHIRYEQEGHVQWREDTVSR